MAGRNNRDNRVGLYCLGSALVDYEFNIEPSYLEKLSLTKGHMTLADTETFDNAFNTLAKELTSHREGGGSAINTLITYSRMGGGRGEVRCGLPCIVGDDDSGKFFLKELRDLGIEIHLVPATSSASPQTTGRCLALITPDKDRTMMTNLGINEQLTTTDDIAERLSGFKVFYAESYLLATAKPCQFLLDHLAEARKQEMFISLSMSDVSMVTYCREQMQQALSGRVDILFGNYNEFSNYTNEKEIDKIFTFFPDYIKCLVLTQGGDGAVVYQRGEDRRHFSLPAVETKVVDTLGAGDTYAGAFLYAVYGQGLNYEDAAQFATRSASQVVSRMGPRLSQEECNELIL